MSEGQEALRAELALVAERIDGLERKQTGALRKLDERQAAELKAAGDAAASASAATQARMRTLGLTALAAVLLAAAALLVVLLRTA
jgi:hypothetical protein